MAGRGLPAGATCGHKQQTPPPQRPDRTTRLMCTLLMDGRSLALMASASIGMENDYCLPLTLLRTGSLLAGPVGCLLHRLGAPQLELRGQRGATGAVRACRTGGWRCGFGVQKYVMKQASKVAGEGQDESHGQRSRGGCQGQLRRSRGLSLHRMMMSRGQQSSVRANILL